MGATQAALRASLRQDLRDEDSAAYIWTDAVLNRHLQHAITAIGETCPKIAYAAKVVAAGATYRLALTPGTDVPTSFLWLEAIEYPLDESPQVFLPFRQEGSYEGSLAAYILTRSALLVASTVRVWYAAKYVVSDGAGDMPVDLDRLAIDGAVSFALTDQSIDEIAKLTPKYSSVNYRAAADAATARWTAGLAAQAHRASAPLWRPSWTGQPDLTPI